MIVARPHKAGVPVSWAAVVLVITDHTDPVLGPPASVGGLFVFPLGISGLAAGSIHYTEPKHH